MSSQTPSRSELIQNAILFLNDPKVHSSTLTSKIEFLQSKGLNESEIQEAIQLAGSGSGTPASGNGYMQQGQAGPSSGGGYGDYQARGGGGYAGGGGGYGQRMDFAPIPPKRDWRDLFIMAVVSGGVVYGLSALARKYLLPHLQPPSSTAFQSTSAEITAQYDEAADLLREVKEQTGLLQKSVDEDRERVNAVVTEVEDAIKAVRNGEETWRGELREIRGEVESVRELVPRMIEKHSASQSSALADLQSELKSLKTLLISRQHLVGNTTNTTNGPNSATQASSGSSAGSQADNAQGYSLSNSTSHPSLPSSPAPAQTQAQRSASTSASAANGTMTPTTAAANALLGGNGGKKSIPAWQLAPASASASASGTSGTSTGTGGEEEKAGEGERTGNSG